MALLALVSGCAQPQASETLLGPAPLVEAPDWRPGFNWSFVVRDASATFPTWFHLVSEDTIRERRVFVGVAKDEYDPGTTKLLADVPGNFHSAELQLGHRSHEDHCMGKSSLDVREPWGWDAAVLQFPLHLGKQWTWMSDHQIAQVFQVSAWETVNVTSGSLQAYRIEVHSDWSKAVLSGREVPPRRHVATLHYAPGAMTIARMSYVGDAQAMVAGEFDRILPIDTQDTQWATLELTALTLEDRPAVDRVALADLVPVPGGCRQTREQVLKEQADKERRALETSALSNAPKFGPKPVVLRAPATHGWDVEDAGRPFIPTGGWLEWHLRSGNGCLECPDFASATGDAFAHNFTVGGHYVIQATTADARGSPLASGYQDVFVQVDLAGDMTCLLAHQAPHPAAPAQACAPFRFTTGPGWAALKATVEGLPGEGSGCAYLELLDPAGKRLAANAANGASGATLQTAIGSNSTGEWSLVWHPMIAVSSNPKVTVTIDYANPSVEPMAYVPCSM